MKKIVIVGGGVNGLCAAYYLRKDGYDVTVIDSGDITDNCSFGNMGIILPSHFVPLASPGIVAEGLRYLLSSTSPFYMKPQMRLSFLRWALKFYTHSTQKMVERNSPYLSELLNLSRKLTDEIREDIGDVFDMEEVGCMMMCQKQDAFEAELKTAEKASQLGLEVEILHRAELQEKEHQVELDIYGAMLYKSDAHIHPGRFMRAMKKHLKETGVHFQLNTKVEGFEKGEGNRIGGVITENGVFQGDEIILCAGSWLPQLTKKLGVDLLLEGGKGYSYDYDYVEKNIIYPAILVDGRCAVTPWKHELRIGGTMEFSGLNHKIYFKRMEGIYHTVKSFYPGLDIEMPPADKVWAGLRPVSPDGLPYIGPLEKYENVFVSGGNAMLGMSAAPAAGVVLQNLIKGGEAPVNIAPFAVERF